MSSPTPPLRPALGAAAFVVLASVLSTFWRALPGDLVFFQRDVLGYWLPHIQVFRAAVHAGDLPLWNAQVSFGAPLLADPNFALLYPPTWLVLLVPPPDYYRLFVVAHAAFGGLGAALLARRLGISAWPGSIVGGVSAVCGPFLSAASLFHHYAGAAWMPWVLAAFVSLRGRPSAGTALAASLAVLGQLLAGSADLCMMTALLGGAWLAWHELGPEARGSRAPFARWLLAALLLAAAAGSAQWIPAFGLVAEGSRGTLPLEARTGWSVHPAGLPDLFAPRLLGRLPLGPEARALLFEGREPLFASMFLGVPALGLALLGAIASRSRWRGFVLGALGTALVLSLGRYTPAFALVHAIPPLSLIRYPAKYALPMALAWALLVGLGADVWLTRWEDRERRRASLALAMLLAVTAALAIAGLGLPWPAAFRPELLDGSWPEPLPRLRFVLLAEAVLAAAAALVLWIRSRRPAPAPGLGAIVAVLVLGDLVAAGQGVNPLAPRALVETAPPIVRALPEGARVHVAVMTEPQTAALFARSALRPLGRVGSAVVALETLRPPLGTRFGLYGSYDDDLTGLAPPLHNALSLVVRSHEDWPVGRRALMLGGVDYVVDVGHDLAGFEEIDRVDSSLGVALRVLRVAGTRPRAFVVEGIRVASDADVVEALITRADFEREALVPAGLPPRIPAHGFVGQARIVKRGTNRLVLEASANRPGLLVVLEAWRRGWTATIDGEPAPVLRTNAIFRGIPVPAGSHRIEMSYLPREVAWGAALGVLGLTGLLLLAVVARRGQTRPVAARSSTAARVASTPGDVRSRRWRSRAARRAAGSSRPATSQPPIAGTRVGVRHSWTARASASSPSSRRSSCASANCRGSHLRQARNPARSASAGHR